MFLTVKSVSGIVCDLVLFVLCDMLLLIWSLSLFLIAFCIFSLCSVLSFTV